jgi:hypothetical protein
LLSTSFGTEKSNERFIVALRTDAPSLEAVVVDAVKDSPDDESDEEYGHDSYVRYLLSLRRRTD